MPIPEGRQLLPFYVNFRLVTFTDLPLETDFFSTGALRVPGASHRTPRDNPNTRPSPHPRLAPLHTLASVASRTTITRRFPTHRDRWRRPALRHPAHSSLDLRERGLMLKVSRACFYRFTQGLHGRALLPF